MWRPSHALGASLLLLFGCADEPGGGSGAEEVGTFGEESQGESDEGSSGDTSSSTETEESTEGPSDPLCAEIADAEGWKTFVCDEGEGTCAGEGIATLDCGLCCAGPSCGELADQQGWEQASCEHAGNGACGGEGEPTWDCDHCCGEPPDEQTLFEYPVGDGSTYPAGGWQVWQVLGHYWGVYGGRHLAQDIAHPGGGVATVDAPVRAMADGVVRYAGPNGSSYRNVVLIEHDLGDGESICAFYGHVTAPLVETGQEVERGEQVTSVLDWALAIDGGASSNTHLHYVLLSKPLCDASAAANGALICGYDKGGPNAIETLDDEPLSYTAVADICGDHMYADAFISPTKFVEMHKQ